MTTFERFERDIPRLMDEIVPTRFPDYVDDLLRQDLERVPVSELEGLSEITPRLLASNIGG